MEGVSWSWPVAVVWCVWCGVLQLTPLLWDHEQHMGLQCWWPLTLSFSLPLSIYRMDSLHILKDSAFPEVRLAWISHVASAFETWPLLNSFKWPHGSWTTFVANPIGKGYSQSPLLSEWEERVWLEEETWWAMREVMGTKWVIVGIWWDRKNPVKWLIFTLLIMFPITW